MLERITDQEGFQSTGYYILSGLMVHEGHRIEEKVEKRLCLLDRQRENFWFSYLSKS
jgi:hypothetical protein